MLGADDTLACDLCICFPFRKFHLGEEGDDGEDDKSEEGDACWGADKSNECTRRIGMGCDLLLSGLVLSVLCWSLSDSSDKLSTSVGVRAGA